MPAAIDRRHLLTALGASAMAASLAETALAAPRRRFFQRIGRPLGLQLYTLGDEPRADLDATLARVAAMGYREIELPQLYGLAAGQVKAAADRAGLQISSLHVPAEDMFRNGGVSFASDASQITDTLQALGARHAVMPIMPFPQGFRPRSMETFGADILVALTAAGPDLWKRTAALLNEKAAVLKRHGLGTGYHNHNVEFAPVGGSTGWQVLARETDPSLVHFEVDTGWIAAAGLDPVAFMNRYRGRIRQMHVKDLKATTMTNFAIAMDPSEVGAGTIDWARVLPAAHRAGVQHFYVEQEPPFTMPRMQAAARSADFLAQLRG